MVINTVYTIFSGDKSKPAPTMPLQGYNIYLHDKGQFWPGLEMDRTGLSKQLFVPKVQSTIGTILPLN